VWIIYGNIVSDEQMYYIQQLEKRIRSGRMLYLILIIKSKGFSQSLSGVLQVVISYGKNQISADSDM
jgi:hypothetical protein